jgi:hypothetical protein
MDELMAEIQRAIAETMAKVPPGHRLVRTYIDDSDPTSNHMTIVSEWAPTACPDSSLLAWGAHLIEEQSP